MLSNSTLTSVHIPFSGRNAYFQDNVIAARPHILLFSKPDLADLSERDFIEDYYKARGVSKILFANCAKQIDVTIKRKLIPAITELIESNPRYDRVESRNYKVLVIGIPNVGKSSLINAIRRMHIHNKGKAARVGAEAGVTRSVSMDIKVCERPPISILDSPGILQPRVHDPNVGMKLALCANLKDHLVGEIMIADYLLFWYNQQRRDEYMHEFSLPAVTDDVHELLFNICRKHDLITKRKALHQSSGIVFKPDMVRAASLAIRAFRQGKLGRVNLDCGIIAHMKLHGQDDEQAIRDALKQREKERLRTLLEARVKPDYPEEHVSLSSDDVIDR